MIVGVVAVELVIGLHVLAFNEQENLPNLQLRFSNHRPFFVSRRLSAL